MTKSLQHLQNVISGGWPELVPCDARCLVTMTSWEILSCKNLYVTFMESSSGGMQTRGVHIELMLLCRKCKQFVKVML